MEHFVRMLATPKGSGLDYQMREKHYNFWLHAKEEPKAKPSFGFEPGSYQREEHLIMSLSRFSQQREAAERQDQQLRINQYRNQGPKLGGQGMR